MNETIYPGRLGIIQRVLPVYRAPFFDALASSCNEGVSLFAGKPRESESIATTEELKVAKYFAAENLHLFSGPFYLCYQQGIKDWLESWIPDALIVEANPRYLSTPTAIYWTKKNGGSVIGWGLGAPPLEGVFASMRRAARLNFLHQFDALVSYSVRGAEQYAATGFPRDRIYVAPNAMAARPISPMPQRANDFGERPVVLFVGRLQARKRVDSLIRTCASFPQKIQPRLIIVGDGPERESLETLARKEYSLAEIVGPKYMDELKPYFAQADLFVLPGTGGLAVQEAMSYGLPVIVAKGDGTQDDLVRASNGWQIPPDDAETLAAALRSALSDSARLRAMGAESYRIVRDEINLEKMVEVFVKALNAIK
jgi:glycosyltransferase involved in cell wall biosynthesis